MPWETIPYDPIEHEPYKMVAHKWTNRFGFQVCQHCGLVALKNDFVKWCIDRGCHYEDHAGYKAQHAKSGIDPGAK